MKILIVDDSGMSRRMLRKILESAGHDVDEAPDGPSALEYYKHHKPEMVFLDSVMPEMQGIEVLTRLRSLDPEARVLMATADIQESTLEMARAAGASGLINKPFAGDQVNQAVELIREGVMLWP